MKKIKKVLLMTFILCLILLTPITTFAKSKKAKAAIKAYKTMLSEQKVYVVPYKTYFESDDVYVNFYWSNNVSFCIGYFTNDNVPELFLKGTCSDGNCLASAIFTYKKGSIQRLWYDEGNLKRYCKKRKVFEVEREDWGGEHAAYYYKKGKAVYLSTRVPGSFGYDKRKVRKYTKGREFTKIKWRANTPANLQKYLK